MFLRPAPPSTSNRIGRPDSSIIFRTLRAFEEASWKTWPLNPGLFDMSKIMSTLCATFSR